MYPVPTPVYLPTESRSSDRKCRARCADARRREQAVPVVLNDAVGQAFILATDTFRYRTGNEVNPALVAAITGVEQSGSLQTGSSASEKHPKNESRPR